MSPNPKKYREDLSKSQFKKLALKIFETDRHQCQYCGLFYHPFKAPLHCHHRVFKSQGGDDQEDNLTACCWICHHDHGNLKNKRLITENDDAKIDELRKRYGAG